MGACLSTGIREANALQASNATFDLKMVDVRDSTNDAITQIIDHLAFNMDQLCLDEFV